MPSDGAMKTLMSISHVRTEMMEARCPAVAELFDARRGGWPGLYPGRIEVVVSDRRSAACWRSTCASGLAHARALPDGRPAPGGAVLPDLVGKISTRRTCAIAALGVAAKVS